MRTLFLHLRPGESTQGALKQSLALLRRQPELWAWDWIVGAEAVPDDASVHQIAQLAEIYVRPNLPATTVLVSDDRFLHLWARVMNFQFPQREHNVMRTVDEALLYLRGERDRREGLRPLDC